MLPIVTRTSDRAPVSTLTNPSQAASRAPSKLLGPRTSVSRLSITDRYPPNDPVHQALSLVTRSDTVQYMVRSGLPNWVRWWGGSLIAAVCAGAAFLAQVQSGEHLSPLASISIKVGGT